MRRGVDFLQPLDRDVGVNLRRLQTGVTELLLDEVRLREVGLRGQTLGFGLRGNGRSRQKGRWLCGGFGDMRQGNPLAPVSLRPWASPQIASYLKFCLRVGQSTRDGSRSLACTCSTWARKTNSKSPSQRTRPSIAATMLREMSQPAIWHFAASFSWDQPRRFRVSRTLGPTIFLNVATVWNSRLDRNRRAEPYCPENQTR